MPAVGYTGGDPNKVSVSGDAMTGVLVLDDDSPAASEEYVAGHGGGGGFPSVPTFNVETFGARGNDPVHDGPAILAAVQAASEAGGAVLFPTRGATYRARASDLLQSWSDGQYAMFPLPRVAANGTTSMRPIGFVGPTGSTAVQGRLFANGSNVLQSHGAPVLQIEYDDAFTWSTDHGLPSVFGAPDADFGGGLSALFVFIDGLIIRQPDDPSLMCFNLENAAACDVRSLYCDTMAFPDATSEPTHPTGGTLLLPRTGNAAWVEVGQVGAWGYYAGPAVSEHSRTTSQFVIACKIAVPMRDRGFAHSSYIQSLTAEECPWGVAGYDPSGEGPNLGVVAAPGGNLRIERADFEDYNRAGSASWMYTPEVGAHVYDPNNQLHGSMRYMRVDSGPDSGPFDTVYTVGCDNFSIYDFSDAQAGATRADGHDPTNPVVDPPNAPTIGTATGGDASAIVTFTPAGTGAAATGFTATSTPDGHTGTNATSPITVSGLTNGTGYTFTVHASNSAGDSAESSASNSATPAASGAATYAADTFTRADSASTLGTSTGGQVWTALNGTWGILSNAAYVATDGGGGGGYNVSALNAGHSLVTYTVSFTPRSGPIDMGPCALVQDVDNYIFWDISGDTLNTPAGVTTKLFKRLGGSFTGITDPATITINPATTYQLKMVIGATSIECFLDGVSLFASTGATGLESQTKFGLVTAAGTGDHSSTFDGLSVTSS